MLCTPALLSVSLDFVMADLSRNRFVQTDFRLYSKCSGYGTVFAVPVRYFAATEPSIADLLIHARDGET